MQDTVRAVALCLVLWVVGGCGDGGDQGGGSEPLVEDMSWGPVRVVFTVDPPRVSLDKDILLTINISTPSEIDISLPPIDDRLEGFVLGGTFDREPVSKEGRTALERRVRLTPVLSDRYRLAPMPISYADRGVSPPKTGWFPTRPVVLPSVSPLSGDPGQKIDVDLKPVWVYPSFRTVSLYVVLCLAVAGVGFVIWKLLHRVRQQVRLMRMSPRERALRELSLLMDKDLVGKHRIKAFYLELTMIVRRYIERQHAIRAPEQTTEEFLAAVGDSPLFSPDTVRKLRAFLVAADLVKFAAYHPEGGAVKKAGDTAREYIETDTGP